MKKLLLSLTLIVPFFLSGCGSKADEEKPVAEVKSEAQTMNLDELEKMALDYKKAIEEKTTEIKEIEEKLKALDPTELLGEKAQELKNQIVDYTNSINKLQEHFNAVLSELKAKGADTSELD